MLRWLTRFSLLAVLVLSQALYAGHSVSHLNGDHPSCDICLQASSAGAALVSTDSAPPLPTCAVPTLACHTLSAASATFPDSDPARAPPSNPV
jgi:hypothetical protein